MSFVVAIPTYNEMDTIGDIIDDLLVLGARVIVVDDSSPNGTKKVAREAGALVYSYKKSDLATAYRHCIEIANSRYVVTMDAGGSHLPEDALALYEMRESADIILAQRDFAGWGRRRIMSSIMALPFPLRDATCGLRCYHRLAILHLLPLVKSRGHAFQAELLKLALSEGLSFATREIAYSLGEKSPIKLWECIEARRVFW